MRKSTGCKKMCTGPLSTSLLLWFALWVASKVHLNLSNGLLGLTSQSTDLLHNDVAKHCGHMIKHHCWQEVLSSVCTTYSIHVKMDCDRVMVDLDCDASKLIRWHSCWVMLLKLSGNKAELIGHLLTYWAYAFGGDSNYEESVAPSSSTAMAGSSGCDSMLFFSRICTCDKDLFCLHKVIFRQLYDYLVNT